MEWNYCLLIFMISLLSQSHAYVEIFHDSKNWIEANNYCINNGGRLAGLEELDSQTCPTISINVWLNKSDHLRLTPWIAKMGCYNGGEKEKNPQNDVLECYRFCKSTPFGYKKPRCYCEKDTRVELMADTPCLNHDQNDYLWLYNTSNVDVVDDDNTKNCISAQCTVNGTILKAANCSSNKFAYCQTRSSTFTNAEKNTQAISETICNEDENKGHLIANQICSSLRPDNSSREFWTGMQRYRYTDSITDMNNCVYARCEKGNAPIENTGNCGQQLEGFACIFNGSSNNFTTEQPSPESSLAPTLISSLEPMSLHVESTSVTLELFSNDISKNAVSSSKNTGSTSTQTNYINTSTTAYNTVVKNQSETEHSESKGIYSTTTRNSYSRSHTVKTEKPSPKSSFLPTPVSSHVESTSVTLELFSNDTSKNSVSSPINTGSTSTQTNNSYTSTTAYNTVVKNKAETEHGENKSIYSTTTWSLYSRSHTLKTVNPSTVSLLISALISSSEPSSLHSSTRNSKLPTSVTPETLSTHASQHGVSAFIKTNSKLPIYSTIDMSSTEHSAALNNKSETDINGRKKIPSTTTTTPNNSSSHQLSTGLIVGISVSILCLVVLIIGVFGICRLRNQRALKEKSLDFPTPINTMNTTNYHDIEFDPKKETKVIENDSTHFMVSANDDDMPLRLTDNTSNGKTNKPSDAYAVVVKKPVTTKVDNTSNSNLVKSNNAHDAYAVVVKTPETNQDRDEKMSLSIPDSNYDSMNQPRPISGNESGNIYDTSIGHRDDTDPTYNTTTHIQEREEKYESDYDHL